MSRIGKLPIALPKGVEVTLDGDRVKVKGPKGETSGALLRLVGIEVKDGAVHLSQLCDCRESNTNVGTMRALVNNMVRGVSAGFERRLTMVGVGYRAQAQGDKINIQVGFSHPVLHQLPPGVTAATPSPTEIVLSGIDRQRVGQTAAELRAYRSPEPYKGKGIRYADERVVIKETKKK